MLPSVASIYIHMHTHWNKRCASFILTATMLMRARDEAGTENQESLNCSSVQASYSGYFLSLCFITQAMSLPGAVAYRKCLCIMCSLTRPWELPQEEIAKPTKRSRAHVHNITEGKTFPLQAGGRIRWPQVPLSSITRIPWFYKIQTFCVLENSMMLAQLTDTITHNTKLLTWSLINKY